MISPEVLNAPTKDAAWVQKMDISTVSSDLFLMTKQSEFNLFTGPFRLGITPSGAAMLSYKTNTFCRSRGNAALTLRVIHNTDCRGSCVFLLFSIFECLLSITPSEILKFYISTRNPSSAENHSAQKKLHRPRSRLVHTLDHRD